MDATIGGPEVSSHLDVKLSSGHTMPLRAFGSGTQWKEEGGGRELIEAVKTALDAGYRHLDCAEIYETEEDVGEAVREYLNRTGFKRDVLFITSKVSEKKGIKNIREACERSIEKLDVGHLDLYLLHSPFFRQTGVTMAEAWNEMEQLVHSGRVNSIGVSNFRAEDLEELLSVANIKPVVNQIECNPFLPQHDITDYCARHSIQVVAYSPLTPLDSDYSQASFDALLDELSRKYGKLPSQILIRWNLQRGHGVVNTSSNHKHIREFMDIMDFVLTPEDLQRIDEEGSTQHVRKFWKDEFKEQDESYLRNQPPTGVKPSAAGNAAGAHLKHDETQAQQHDINSELQAL